MHGPSLASRVFGGSLTCENTNHYTSNTTTSHTTNMAPSTSNQPWYQKGEKVLGFHGELLVSFALHLLE